MASRREEERIEKIIRGLMKLPPNRKCINCNSMGPQYVCTNFWTFVCTICSGIHREFTHRVKSVSMAKFTKQEVEALQSGGNQRARELFLSEWDTQRMRLPDSSNAEKVRAFIRDVYINKKYIGGKSLDKPPGEIQSFNKHEEEQRRASSYHSFSQSPPYENQYEDRRYGKHISKRPGSDRGPYEGKLSGFLYSPGRLQEKIYEDRFAYESSGSRTSDYSISSIGDPFRFDGQSPNFHESGYNISPFHQVRDISIEDSRFQNLKRYSDANSKRDLDGFSRPQRTASSSSFGSFDSNSISLKSVNSGSIVDAVLEPEHSINAQHAIPSTTRLPQSSAFMEDKKKGTFPSDIQPTIVSSSPSLDLFSDISYQPSSTNPPEQKPSTVPISQNEGWATFDLPRHVGPALGTDKGISAVVCPVDLAPKGSDSALATMHKNSKWFPVQNSVALGLFPSSTGQGNLVLKEDRTTAYQRSAQSQSWNAFGDSEEDAPHTLVRGLTQEIKPQHSLQASCISVDPYVGLIAPEGPFKGGPPADSFIGSSPPFNVVSTSFPPQVLPLMAQTPQMQKSTNPFDLPYDLNLEANNMFEVRSLHEALPNPQLPANQIDGFSQTWFHQNAVSTYGSSLPNGGLAHMARQVPGSPLQNLPQQGHVGALGGNPFA